jgi:hypothetical protein
LAIDELSGVMPERAKRRYVAAAALQRRAGTGLGSDVRHRTDRERLTSFLDTLGRRLRRPVRFYLVGGSVLIDLGLRGTTLGINCSADADDPSALTDLERPIRVLKNDLDVNVEPASPADFLPTPRSVFGRSRYVGRHGQLDVHYDHLPSLVLVRAARGLEQDLADAERLISAGEVDWRDVEAMWSEVRASPTGCLRYEPDEVEQRLDVLRRRLDITPV